MAPVFWFGEVLPDVAIQPGGDEGVTTLFSLK